MRKLSKNDGKIGKETMYDRKSYVFIKISPTSIFKYVQLTRIHICEKMNNEKINYHLLLYQNSFERENNPMGL